MHKIIALYNYFSDKRYSTIAGTLVYFLLMSITPFLFWLTLLAGNVDISKIISHEIFAAVEPVVSYMQKSAESAVGGAGILLLATSLYSSTNFFYHLRRSGEIIYGEKRRKGGIRLRLSSLGVIALIIIAVAAVAVITVIGYDYLTAFMPENVVDIIVYTFVILISVGVAYLLNIFACPYKLEFEQAIAGSLLTTILWVIFAAGFTVYLNFANPSRLYGKIAALIVFLLWCYLMTNSLVIGIIYNGMYLTEKKPKKLF